MLVIVTDTGNLFWNRDDHVAFGLMINAEALMSYLGGKIYEALRNQNPGIPEGGKACNTGLRIVFINVKLNHINLCKTVQELEIVYKLLNPHYFIMFIF